MVRRKGIKFVVFLLSHFRLFMPWQMFVESLMLTILDDMITLLRISSLIKGWEIATCLAHFRIPRRIVAALHAQYLNDLTHYHVNAQWIGRVFFQSNTYHSKITSISAAESSLCRSLLIATQLSKVASRSWSLFPSLLHNSDLSTR